MQISFHFPVIDLRYLSSDSEGPWPSPEMNREAYSGFFSTRPFIRNFGAVRQGDNKPYSRLNCVKIRDQASKGWRIDNRVQPIFHVSGRLSYEGFCKLNAEIGFYDQLEAILNWSDGCKEVFLSDIIAHYAKTELEVKDPGSDESAEPVVPKKVFLKDAGPLIVENYRQATALYFEDDHEDNEVTGGEGCITLMYGSSKKIKLPPAAKLIEDSDNNAPFKLWNYRINFDGQWYKVWIFEILPYSGSTGHSLKQTLQNRLESLVKLNTEKESLKIFSRQKHVMEADPGLKKTVGKTSEKILRNKRFQLDQSRALDIALEGSVREGEPSLEELLHVMKQLYAQNLQTLQEKMAALPVKKKVLFIASSPSNLNPIDIGEQIRSINDALDSGTDRDNYQFIIVPGVKRSDFSEILDKHSPDYLHITLHASGINGLYFQGNNKEQDPMDVEEFTDYIKLTSSQKPMEAVLLIACNSYNYADAIKGFCRYSVGTSYVFPENAAIVYAQRFYKSLFNGKTVDHSHSAAILAIKHTSPEFEKIDEFQVYEIPKLILPN